MKTKTNPAMGGGASASKKLLAAVAVLAVAFVVLAAIPAVDATDDETGTGSVATALPEAKDEVITLTADVSYVLTKDITVQAKQIDLAGFDISVSGKGTLTLKAQSLDTQFLTNSSKGTQSKVTVAGEGAELVITNSDLGRHQTAGDSLIYTNINGTKGIAFVADNKATIDFESKDSSVSTFQTGSGNTTISVLNESKLVYNAGSAQGMGIVMNGSTAKINNLEGTTFAAYWSLDNSKVDATDVDIYAASLKNKSDLNASGFVAFYSNKNASNAFTTVDELKSLDLSTVVVDKESSIEAVTYYTLFNYVANENTQPITFAGEGKVTGDLQFVHKMVVNGKEVDRINLNGFILKGVLFNGTASYTDSKEVFSSASFVNIRGDSKNGSTIAAGSVEISGSFTTDSAGNITVTGDAVITGNSTLDKGLTLTVESGATLTVESSATLTVNEKATLSVAGTATGNITNKGTVEAVNGGNLIGATIGGDGKVTSKTDDSDKENVNIDGTIKGTENTYDADQIVTINGDTKIVAGAVLTINGTLIVKEGVTLTLEAGSKLVIASNAVMDIQGTVVVEEAYGVSGESGYVDPAEFEINGNVAVYGALDVNGKVTFVTGTVSIEQDGVVDILSEGRIEGTPSAYKFVVKASGTLNVEGSVAAMKIENNGSIVFDSKVKSGNITVDMKNGAVVDVKNITLAKDGYIELNDDGTNAAKLTATAAGTKASGATTITDDADVKAVISGISVSETVTSKTVSGSTTPTYTYVMTVSGSAAVSPIYLGTGDEPSNMAATATVELNGFATTTTAKSKLTLAEGLTVGENVTLENKGTLEVTVIVDATKGAVNNTGKITVSDSGSIVVKQEKISNDANINASKYSVAGTTASDKTYYYVTLDNALAAAATGTTKDITVLGKQTLVASAELVSGATLNIDGATLVIGSGDNASDVVLTVKSGATVKGTPAVPTTTDGKAIDVKGTVYAENKRDLKTGATDALNKGAAVYSEQMDDRNRPVSNGWAKWTNVYTAMADSTLTVVKLINDITLDKNLTIPEGKTLDTNGKNVTAEKNVVITVEGTLDIGAGSVITLKKVGDESASIVVKGLIASDNDLDSTDGVIRTSTSTTSGETTTTTVAKYLPLGAYYSIDSTNYMTTVEKAVAIISTVDEQTVTIKGTDDNLTVAGDIAFAGKSAEEPATVVVQIKEIAFSGSVSIDNAVIKFDVAAKVSGTFTNGSGSVALKGLTDTTSKLSIASVTEDGTAVLTVSGKLSKITGATDADTIKQTFTVTGAVTVSAIDLENATVDGTLTVKGTNTIATLKVNGSVVISASGVLNSTTATVLGTLTASEKTSASGSMDAVFKVHVLYIGTTKDAVGAAASVTGSVVLNDANAFAVVAAGSTADAFTAEGSTFKSTAYYVDNGLYVTVYANGTNNVAISDIKAEKENAWFSAWKNDDGKSANGKTVGFDGFSKVTADFMTEIFNVIVNADSAVDNLYIDGNLMTKNGTQFTLVGSKLAAGAHTFSYTLKNGYSGEGTFKIIGQKANGVSGSTSVDIASSVSGKTLTLSGTPTSANGITVELQLTGFTASGYTPVTPVTPSEDKDDGMSLTDILLIVLVILIVIMAIIVAMRLMRS